MQSYWDDMEGHMGMNPMVSQFIQRSRISVPDDTRKEQAKTWDFIWDDAGACWRCWRCLVTVQQFKNLKRHYGGVKCRQRSCTLACQSSRQMLRAGGFKVRHLLWVLRACCGMYVNSERDFRQEAVTEVKARLNR